jgi:hypothetical protein
MNPLPRQPWAGPMTSRGATLKLGPWLRKTPTSQASGCSSLSFSLARWLLVSWGTLCFS